MFQFVLKVTRVSLCVDGYVFHFVLKVIRVYFVLRVTSFTLC